GRVRAGRRGDRGRVVQVRREEGGGRGPGDGQDRQGEGDGAVHRRRGVEPLRVVAQPGRVSEGGGPVGQGGRAEEVRCRHRRDERRGEAVPGPHAEVEGPPGTAEEVRGAGRRDALRGRFRRGPAGDQERHEDVRGGRRVVHAEGAERRDLAQEGL